MNRVLTVTYMKFVVVNSTVRQQRLMFQLNVYILMHYGVFQCI